VEHISNQKKGVYWTSIFMAMSKDVGICHILTTVVSNRNVLVLIMFPCNKYQITKTCLELNVS